MSEFNDPTVTTAWDGFKREEDILLEDVLLEEEDFSYSDNKDNHYDVESTSRASKLAKYSDQIGNFAAKYDNIVSSVDGVGTKILLAQYARLAYNRPLNSIGQDAVAMVVNDLLCRGAKPLFFLDYFASNKIPHDQFYEILEGIHLACKSINIPLIGGETAALPGIIIENSFDVAGFGVGRIECKDDELPRDIKRDDVVIGIKSSGFHSNGFTLIRKNIGWRESGNQEFLNKLLEPTKIYVNDIMKIEDICKNKLLAPKKIKGLAHITGGGFDNIQKILPKNMIVKYTDRILYERPYLAHEDLFEWIQERETFTMDQMYATFNCGIGMVAILNPEDAESLERANANYVKRTIVKLGTIQRSLIKNNSL